MKGKIIILLIAVALLIPAIKINYYNGVETEIKRQSIVKIIFNDIKDGTLGTGL